MAQNKQGNSPPSLTHIVQLNLGLLCLFVLWSDTAMAIHAHNYELRWPKVVSHVPCNAAMQMPSTSRKEWRLQPHGQ
eukprot:1158514-Pelagomonas_calceolata.AAC.10